MCLINLGYVLFILELHLFLTSSVSRLHCSLATRTRSRRRTRSVVVSSLRRCSVRTRHCTSAHTHRLDGAADAITTDLTEMLLLHYNN